MINASMTDILITGASGGIGRAIAASLAAPGRCLLLHYAADQAGIDTSAAAVTAAGAEALVVQADLATKAGRDTLCDAVQTRQPNCNVLINNAGGPVVNKPLAELQEEDVERVIGVNYLAALRLSQTVFPGMCERGYGRVVSISSIGLKFGGSDRTVAYAGAKSALETLSMYLARQGAASNVLVNVVRAGVIDTPLHTKFPKDLEQRRRLIPLQRLGQPADVAGMVNYLVSDSGNYITGQLFSVAGGE